MTRTALPLRPSLALAAAALLAAAGCSTGTLNGPPWMEHAYVQVPGVGSTETDCRNRICQHNENTDLISFGGSIWLVHRTAQSQILGPNSALHVYRSEDGGIRFVEVALFPAPSDNGGRDIRDPHFYVAGGDLFIKALTRKPFTSSRDSNVDTVAVAFRWDGTSWSSVGAIGPVGWSFWRVREHAGTLYTAAYHDGDSEVDLFSSTDGVHFTQGAPVYGVAADTPLETELTFDPPGAPSGTLLALVRMDGTDQELLGAVGRLRTKVCWAQPPYATFTCPQELTGYRLDGPLTFTSANRLFVVARKHLQPSQRKRTALYELTGDFAAAQAGTGALAVKEWGELPSAGDTAYAGVTLTDASHALLSWYSSDVAADESWSLGMLDATDIWLGTVDLDKLR